MAPRQGSHFSDNALSTFESLVLEAQLESAHQALEEQHQSKKGSSSGKRGSKKSSTPKHHQMPFEEHEYIAGLGGNDKCADCGAADTEWASVSFGIVLCTECSGIHRSLGTHVSRVRSIKMDSWTDNHIKAMRLGGNKKCRDYLQKQGLDLSSCSIQERYESPVAQKYHQKLKKQVKVVDEKHPAMEKSKSQSSLNASSTHSRKSLNLRGSHHSRMSQRSSLSPPRNSMSSARPSYKSPKSLSVSCPTIVYMGRSFKANSPHPHDNEETLRINDEVDVTRKLEEMWYGNDEDNPMSSNQSYASTSISSSSMSRSSYFGGISVNNYTNVTELSMKDMASLQHDLDVKEYVRQQLLKQWKTTTRR